MRTYFALRNERNSFVFMRTAAQSSSARPDEKSNLKEGETARDTFYPVIPPYNQLANGFWRDIKNAGNIVFFEDNTMPFGFLNRADYTIQKNLLSYSSAVQAFKPDTAPVIDLNQYDRLKAMLQEEITESGIANPSEKIIESLYAEDKQKANILLNKLFLENFHTPHIIAGILHIISHFDYDIVSPEGQIMAIAALSHKDVEVREYGIKFFENWQHKDGIRILEQIKADERWLQNYINLVIRDLKTLE
jgi:hypothetical protein